MSSGANEATVRLGGASAATSPVVFLCACCAGVLALERDEDGQPQGRPHGAAGCISELKRQVAQLSRRVRELEGREEL
ncbi:MAG TPA: hypothetical protein VLI71_05755 [Gammaproteobacteria bacterium]|nr:hypothetical protein [Gammaproteobacteria bacterium]